MNKLKKIVKKIWSIIDYNLRHHRWFTVYTGHKRVLFPCCSLSEGNPELAFKIFSYLNQLDRKTGLWQDCCGKPLIYSHALKAARQAEINIINKIKKHGITEIITPCVNCFTHFTAMFETLNEPPKLTFLYDTLLKTEKKFTSSEINYLVHQPCPARKNTDLHHSFEKLTKKMNITISPKSKQYPLSCCLAKTPQSKEKIKRNKSNQFITYCAHCVQTFQKSLSIKHVLEIFFKPEKPIKKSSFIRKLLNKRKLKKMVDKY